METKYPQVRDLLRTRLRPWRKDGIFNLAEFAEAVDQSPRACRSWVSGERRPPEGPVRNLVCHKLAILPAAMAEACAGLAASAGRGS